MLEAIDRGLRILLVHKKAVLSLYLLNLSLGLLLAVPFMAALEDSLGEGLYREKLSADLDSDWYLRFRERAAGATATFSPATALGMGPFVRNLSALLDGGLQDLPAGILAVGLLSLLLNSFVTAAAVGSVAFDPAGTNLREFLRTGGEFFGRFFRLTLIALLTYGLIHLSVLEPVRGLFQTASLSAATDRIAFNWEVAPYLITFLILILLNFTYDYAKIIAAVEDRTSVSLSLLAALRFCLSRFRSAFALYLLLGTLGLVWVLIYGGLEHLIPQQSGPGILAALMLQQLYIVGRLSLRFLFYTAQMQFFLEREDLYRPDQNPCPPPSDEGTPALPVLQ